MARKPNYKEINLEPLGIGNSTAFTVEVRNSAGEAIDVTGDKFYLTVKEHPEADDDTAQVQVSVVAPAGAESTAGDVPITLLAADTVGATAGTYHYDCLWLKLVSAPGERESVQHGRIELYYTATTAQA